LDVKKLLAIWSWSKRANWVSFKKLISCHRTKLSCKKKNNSWRETQENEERPWSD